MAPYGHPWYQATPIYQGLMAHPSDYAHGGQGMPVYMPYGNSSTAHGGHAGYGDSHFGPLPPRFSIGQQQPAGVYRNGDM